MSLVLGIRFMVQVQARGSHLPHKGPDRHESRKQFVLSCVDNQSSVT